VVVSSVRKKRTEKTNKKNRRLFRRKLGGYVDLQQASWQGVRKIRPHPRHLLQRRRGRQRYVSLPFFPSFRLSFFQIFHSVPSSSFCHFYFFIAALSTYVRLCLCREKTTTCTFFDSVFVFE